MLNSADSPMIIRVEAADGLVRANAAFCAKVGFAESELAEKPLLDWIDPGDHSSVRAVIEGSETSCRARHRTRTDEVFNVELRASAHEQGVVVLVRPAADPAAPDLELDSIDEASVLGTLDTIARIVERQNPGFKCSILLVADGRFVRGAGPSLPESYNAAIDGYAIGPTVGSCGTAIFWNVPVVVTDIQADPLWGPFAELAKTAGVAACWSHPFTTRSGNVLGALALYSPEPREPTAEQMNRLRAAAHMTGLAVERGRAEEALRETRKREREREAQILEVMEQCVAERTQDLSVAVRRADAANSAKSQFLANMSHEIRTPMNGVINMTDFLLDSELTVDQRDCAHTIRESGQHLLHVVNDILDYSKLEAGELSLEAIAFDPRFMIRSLAALLGPSAVERGCELTCSASDDVPEALVGDPVRLRQVLTNLLSNAIKFTLEGEVSVHVDVVSRDAMRAEISFAVRDTGIGIPFDKQASIFDAFAQADESTTRRYGGTGLGLSISRRLVRMFGGELELESEPEKGSTFRFSVGFDVAADAVAESSVPVTHKHALEDLRVLVVDDNLINLKVAKRILETSGASVILAENGQVAIEQLELRSGEVDVVLMDCQMPVMDGYTATEKIRAHQGLEHIRIIAMTASVTEADRVRCLESGMDDFIGKPVDRGQLIAKLLS